MLDIVWCEAPSTAHEQKAQKQLFRNSPKAKFCSDGFSRHEPYLPFASSERAARRHNWDVVLPMSVSSCRAARGRVMFGLRGKVTVQSRQLYAMALHRNEVLYSFWLRFCRAGTKNERPHALQTSLPAKLRRISPRCRSHVVWTQLRWRLQKRMPDFAWSETR